MHASACMPSLVPHSFSPFFDNASSALPQEPRALPPSFDIFGSFPDPVPRSHCCRCGTCVHASACTPTPVSLAPPSFLALLTCNHFPILPTLQVWDLRARKCLYTIPGHRSLVSSVKYERAHGGSYIISGGYDCLIKVQGVYCVFCPCGHNNHLGGGQRLVTAWSSCMLV